MLDQERSGNAGRGELHTAGAQKRKALGRGLSALMKSTVSEQPASASVSNLPPVGVGGNASLDSLPTDTKNSLMMVPTAKLVPNALQPRKHFHQEDLESLAQSIRESGILQPILVRRKDSTEDSSFEIVAGERRYRAAKLAEVTQVPVILKDLSDKEALELGIIENIQRADLDPIEEALAYQRLVEEFKATHTEIAKSVGKDRTSVVNALRLLKLPQDLQALIADGKLSAGHGRALLMCESSEARERLARKIVDEGLSVRAAEQLATGPSAKQIREKKQARVEKSPSVLDLEERLRRALGTKVSLTLHSAGKGEVRVSFFSQSELERLFERLGA